MEEIKHEKNKELAEKQELQLAYEQAKANIKKDIIEFEHKLKMERLNKQLEIVTITGKNVEEIDDGKEQD